MYNTSPAERVTFPYINVVNKHERIHVYTCNFLFSGFRYSQGKRWLMTNPVLWNYLLSWRTSDQRTSSDIMFDLISSFDLFKAAFEHFFNNHGTYIREKYKLFTIWSWFSNAGLSWATYFCSNCYVGTTKITKKSLIWQISFAF